VGKRFSSDSKKGLYRGILFRLPHCFGRGLVIFRDDVPIKKYDIISIIYEDKRGDR